MKAPRIGTWVSNDGLVHALHVPYPSCASVYRTACGLTPFFDTDGHVLNAFMLPTCVRCAVAPPLEDP